MLTRDDIAQRWRITTETLRKRFECEPDFPKPALKLSRRTVLWAEADIARFEARRTAQLP